MFFGFFTNEMKCERSKQNFSNKVILLNATSVLTFEYKKARKTSSKHIIQLVYFNYYKGKSVLFSLKIRTVYNIISHAEKEG